VEVIAMRFRRSFLVVVVGLPLVFSTLFTSNAVAYNRDGRFHFEANFEALTRDITQESASFLGRNFPEETAAAESLRLFGKLSVRIIDPIEIYGLAGGSDLGISDFGYNADFGGAYGGGARIVLFREEGARNPFEFFTEYRFLTYKTSDSVHFAPTDDANGNGTIDPGEELTNEIVKEKIRWTEHSLKFGVMGRHDEFEPYGGIRFSIVRGKDFIPSQAQPLHLDLKQSDTFGIFAGTAYYLAPSEKAALFIEGSLFDQYSLTGGVRVGF
jgi:opacity protein-like surface antigen